MTQHLRTSLRAVATLLIMLPACRASTDPQPIEQEVDFEGIHVGQVLGLSGRPFALRVSSEDLVLVTQQDDATVKQFVIGDIVVRAEDFTVGTDPGDVIFTADGDHAMISTFIDGDVHFVTVASGVEDILPIGSNAYRLALSASQQRLFVTTTYGRVYSVNRLLRQKVDSVQLGGSIQAIAVNPMTQRVAVASTAGNIWLLDPNTLDVVDSEALGAGAMIQELEFSPNGQRLYAASEFPNWVAVLDGATLARVDSIGFTPTDNITPFGMALSPDGEVLIVSSATSGRAAIIDALSGDVLNVLALGGTPRRIAFDRTGARAFIANELNWVDVIR